MNAAKVFQLWRRILRDPALERDVFGGTTESLRARGLDPEEAEAAAQLARYPAAAEWPIRGYRFRVGALGIRTFQRYAPMTATVLGHHGRLDPAVRRFLEAGPWRENSQRLVHLTRDFLHETLQTADAELVAGFRDAIRLELAATELLLRLAPLPPEAWTASAFVVQDGELYQLSQAAAIVIVDHDLAPWIEDPDHAGQEPLDPAPQQVMLVHLRDVDALPEYARLTRAAAAVCAELQHRPLDVAAVAAIIGQNGEARARAMLTRFAALGVVRPEAGPARAEPGLDAQPVRYREWEEVLKRQAENASHPIREALNETVIDECGELQGARVLDLGAGDGRSAAAIARRGAHVTGVDLARGSLAAARAWADDTLEPELAGRLDFQEMDAGALTFADGSFDRVTCQRALWLFPDIPRVLAGVNRILRPGGRLVVQLWELAAGDALTAIDPPWMLGKSIVARFVPDLRTADYVPSSGLTADLLESMHRDAGLPARLLVHRRIVRRMEIETPAEYWGLLSVFAANIHVFYARQPPEVRAAMDEEWRMESARFRSRAGSYPLDIAWGVAVFIKDD